jgi:CBS domain-containing protein
MTRDVVTTTPTTPIGTALRQPDMHEVTSMPVVDGDGHLVGIVSEADLLRAAVGDDPRAHGRGERTWAEPPPLLVRDVMTVHLVTVDERTDATQLARLMLETGFKSVPVVRGDVVVGVVSRRDMVHALATTDERMRQQITDLLASTGYDDWLVTVQDGDVVVRAPAGPPDPRDAHIAETLAGTVLGVRTVHVTTDHRRSEVGSAGAGRSG